MVSTFTTNKSLEKPATGDQVGTWGGITVNPNMDKIDTSFGGLAIIPVAASNVTLSSGQYQCVFLNFTGTITADIDVHFPAVGSFYIVQNLTRGSSAHVIKATCGGNFIGLPPAEPVSIFSDGTLMLFQNLGRVGSYWDYAGAFKPLWIDACSIPPYLLCNGATFSSATYPELATLMGGNTLPDARGRTRFNRNDTTGRIQSSAGLDGETMYAGGGSESVTIAQANIPNYGLPVTDPGHNHTGVLNRAVICSSGGAAFQGGGLGGFSATPSLLIDNNTTGITVASGGSGQVMGVINPGYVGGITLIRAA